MLRQRGEPQTFAPGMRWALVMLIGAILVAIMYVFSHGISGNDFWWHVKVGEWIVEHRQIPHSDIFSWHRWEMDMPWTAHEWLADVIFYGIHEVWKDVGIYLFSLLAALFLMTRLLLDGWKYIQNNIIGQ